MKELLIFLGMYIISSVLWNTVLDKDNVGAFALITRRLAFIGVVVHELAHYTMGLIVGRRPEEISVKWRTENGYRSPHGHVDYAKPPSLLQAILTCFAPLYIGTWLFFFFLNIALSPYNISPLINILCGFLCVSIALAAAPSSQDLRNIPAAFKVSPSNSLYSLLLVGLSGLILWFLLIMTGIVFILDAFYYLSIAGIYWILKGSVYGIKSFIYRIRASDVKKPMRSYFRGLTRRRYKPKKPYREWYLQ